MGANKKRHMKSNEDRFEKYAPWMTGSALIVAMIVCSLEMRAELRDDFLAIHYLEQQGYSSVRILRTPAEGHGCSPEDIHRFVFDATSQQEKMTEGIVCFDGMSWYEE